MGHTAAGTLAFGRALVRAGLALALGATLVGSAAAASPQARGFGPITFAAPANLPGATAGEAYSYSFCQPARAQCGRTKPSQPQQNPTGGLNSTYNVQLKPGSRLPAGLALNSASGVLHGTPKSAGSSTFTVCVTDRPRPLKGRITWGPACRTTSLRIAPAAPPPDFTLAAAPAALSLTAGGAAAASAITVAPVNGFTGVVTFSASAPAGFTVTFVPPSSAAGTAMSVTAALTAPLGNTTLTVRGTGGGKTHTTMVTLTVAAPPPTTVNIGGTWNGNFTADIAAPGCTAKATGTVRFALNQNGTAIAGPVTWNLANITNAAGAGCNAAAAQLLAWNGVIQFAGVVSGDTATGGGFTIRKQTDNAVSGTYVGAPIAGVNVNATFTAFRG